MSFFKDFKEDLSQAVNELMPEDKVAPVSEEPQMVDTITGSDNAATMDDISELLKQFDTAAMEQPKVEEPAPVFQETQPVATEPTFVQPEQPVMQAQPVYDVPVQPVFTEEVQPVAAPAPEVEPQEYKEPVQPIFPVEDTPAEPEVKSEVEPIFKESLEKSAPINTTESRYMETGVIIEGMTVTGDIKSDGNLDIRGAVEGNIELLGKLQITGELNGNSKASEVFADGAKITGDIEAVGSVKVGQGTVIRGNITATSGVFAGAVKGDIDINGPVILDSTSVIMGNIKSKSIQINNGAIIEGLCSQCYADNSAMSIFGDVEKEKTPAKTKAKKAGE